MSLILFNGESRCAWQTDENIEVMVSNRNGKDCQIFCRAKEVQLGDNVWEHNIVQSMKIIPYELPNVKYHYGRTI